LGGSGAGIMGRAPRPRRRADGAHQLAGDAVPAEPAGREAQGRQNRLSAAAAAFVRAPAARPPPARSSPGASGPGALCRPPRRLLAALRAARSRGSIPVVLPCRQPALPRPIRQPARPACPAPRRARAPRAQRPRPRAAAPCWSRSARRALTRWWPPWTTRPWRRRSRRVATPSWCSRRAETLHLLHTLPHPAHMLVFVRKIAGSVTRAR